MPFPRPAWILVVLLATKFVGHAETCRSLSTDQRALTEIDWRLVSLGPAGAEVDVIPGTTVTLKLGDNGRVSGSTGCNSYSGTYEVRDDSISFGRLISTKRACLDQNANQQEQRFLSALEMASRFKLSSNRLTIFSDRARNVLNFVSESPADPDDGPPRDDRNDPAATLASYYLLINSRDYRRAYQYWESPPSSYEQFSRGFADTDRVRILIEPPARPAGAAGSVYAEILTMVVATTRSGKEPIFAGCYGMRKANERDTGWKIYRADVAAVPSSARVLRILSQSCVNSR